MNCQPSCFPLPIPGPVYLTMSQGDARYLPASSGGVAYLTRAEADELYLSISGDGEFLTQSQADALYVPLTTLPTLLTVSGGDTRYIPSASAGAFLTVSAGDARYAPIGTTGGISIGFGSETFFQAGGVAVALSAGQAIFRQQVNLQAGAAPYLVGVEIANTNATAGAQMDVQLNFPANSANPGVQIIANNGEQLYLEQGQNNNFPYTSKVVAVFDGAAWSIW